MASCDVMITEKQPLHCYCMRGPYCQKEPVIDTKRVREKTEYKRTKMRLVKKDGPKATAEFLKANAVNRPGSLSAADAPVCGSVGCCLG